MNATRGSLEDAWSMRLRIALTCYRLAANETRLMQAQRENGLMAEPDGSFAYRQALEKEKEALAEYRRILQIFSDLMLYHKIPNDDAAGES